MKLIVLCVVAWTLLANGERFDYSGYSVQRITPITDADVLLLKGLEALGAKFWTAPSTRGHPCDIMFPPNMTVNLPISMITQRRTFIKNVQALIDKSEQKTNPGGKLGFDTYGSLEQIYDFLYEVAAASNGKAKVIEIGKSYENLPLLVLEISTGPSAKPAIWLDANIHAREWITSAVCTCFINELLNGNNAKIKSWAESFDFYIMCVMNPDGLVYTKTTDRLWRKTRSRPNSTSGCCGVDANRNFGYKWLTVGASTNPCSDEYAGPEAFSEVESQAVRDFITSISSRMDAYISLHSYGQLFMLPFGTDNRRIDQYEDYMNLGNSVAQAMEARGGTDWKVGNIVDLLYPVSGGSMDWVKASFNTSVTLTYELRDKGDYGFLLPPDQILPSCQEFLDGFKVIINYLRNGVTTPPLDTKKTSPAPATLTRTRIVPSILNRPAGHHGFFGRIPR